MLAVSRLVVFTQSGTIAIAVKSDKRARAFRSDRLFMDAYAILVSLFATVSRALSLRNLVGGLPASAQHDTEHVH